MEEWKRIFGHPNYEVSRDGRVRKRPTHRELKIYRGPRGTGTPYVRLSLAGGGEKNVYIPQLLLEHFGSWE